MLVSGHACGVVAPALRQVPPYGTLVLRAGWRLAVSLRSVGLVTSVVPSGVSGSPSQSQAWAHRIATFRVTGERPVCMLCPCAGC